MKSAFYILLILIYTALSRLFFFESIPMVLNTTVTARFLSIICSFASSLLLFFIAKNYFGKSKIALLSVWFFVNLPWAFEQGRIVSPVSFALFFILLTILIFQTIANKYKYALFIAIPAILFFAYPQFWLFRLTGFKFELNSLVTNLIILSSADFLFFKNITFWWGGIKEFGIMLLSSLPFFVFGIYSLLICGEKKLLLLLLFILFMSGLSPFFPESREFYLSVPIISIILAVGAYQWSVDRNRLFRSIFIVLTVFMLYELLQFFHFYFIHYPQLISGQVSQIHEAF